MTKDDPFDRLLERAASLEGSARPAGACLDAETVAAWADGSLADPARAAVELHTADCERCLAMVAAFAKTAPPPIEAQRSTWFSLRWLVPVTTGIVVVGVWALLQTRPEESRQVALNTQPAIDAIGPAPATSPPQQERDVAAQTQPAPASEAKNAAPTRAAQSRQPAEAPRRDEAREKNELQKRLARDGVITQTQSTTAAAPPAGAVLPNVPPPAPPPTAPSAQGAVPSLPSQREVVSTPAPFAAAAGRGGGARQGMRAPLLIQSPDPNMSWRLAAPPVNITLDGVSVGRVERSTDGGRTWTPQETGTAGDLLLAGASPAPNVCWLVGRQGTVLLTTDGTSWRRIEFPEPKVDLVAVTARDALSATVTTADRRVYHTDDGGKTWRLQEIPPAAF